MRNLSLTNKNGRALVLTAHPDDETMWLGGTILRHPEIHWTIFALCRRSDPDRYPKYLKACQFYQAQALITDLEDDDVLTIKQIIPEIKKQVNQLLKRKKFDYIFTHGVNGEYGHPRHIGVHQAVKKLLKEKKLANQQIFYFCYQGENHGDNSHLLNNFKKAEYVLKLTNQELATKRKIINQLYGFTKNSFEYLSCLKQETFN